MKEPSQFKSRKEWEVFIWEKIVENLSQVKSRKELSNLLKNILTINEKRMIIKRSTAISLIRQGKSYRAISEILWISPGTISAIKKNLIGSEGYKSKYEYTKNKEHIFFI